MTLLLKKENRGSCLDKLRILCFFSLISCHFVTIPSCQPSVELKVLFPQCPRFSCLRASVRDVPPSIFALLTPICSLRFSLSITFSGSLC